MQPLLGREQDVRRTGWTGVIARLLDLFGRAGASDVLLTPKERLQERLVRDQVGGNE